MTKLFAILITTSVCTFSFLTPATGDDLSPTSQLQSLRHQVQSFESLNFTQLESLAAQAGQLPTHLNNKHQKLQAMSIRQAALFELAWQAKDTGNVRNLAYYLGQIRSTALSIGQLDGPQAPILADYWRLQADLFDINAAAVGDLPKAKLRIDRMKTFIERWPRKNDQKNRIVNNVIVGLLREYDEAGETDCACDLVDQIRDIFREDAAMAAGISSGFEYCNLLDQTILPEKNGSSQNSTTDGKFTLFHFYADWHTPSLTGFEPLSEINKSSTDNNLKIISVNLGSGGPPADIAEKINWQIIVNSDHAEILADQLAVVSLPRYVLIDDAGRVLSSGAHLSGVNSIFIRQLDETGNLREASSSGGRGSGDQSTTVGPLSR